MIANNAFWFAATIKRLLILVICLAAGLPSSARAAAPVVTDAIADQTLAQGASMTVDISSVFNDPDGDTLSYTVSTSAANTAKVSLSGTTLTVEAQGVTATATVTVAAADPGGQSVSDSFNVTVVRRTRTTAPSNVRLTAGDDLPQLTVSWDWVDDTGGICLLTGSRSAFEVEYKKSTEPEFLQAYRGLQNSADRGTFELWGNGALRQFVIKEGAIGNRSEQTGVALDRVLYDVRVQAYSEPCENGRLLEPNSVYSETVSATLNRAPAVANGIADQTVSMGSVVTVELEATGSDVFADADGDALSYEASSDDLSKVTVSLSGSTVTVTGITVGTATVTVTAADGKDGEVSDEFTVTVTPPPPLPNRPPFLLTPVGDQTLGVNETLTLAFSDIFDDPDQDVLVYTATTDESSVVAVSMDDAAARLTLTGMSVGAAEVTMTVSDGRGGTASDQFTLTVTLPNEAPQEALNHAPEVATPLSDQRLDVAQTRQLDLSAVFTDADGDELTCTAESADTSVVTVAMAGTTLTLTGASAGAAAVTVTASDEHGAAADDTFRVTVVALNHAPAVATPLSDQALELAQTRQVDISAAFTDADDDALNYTATLGDESIATASLVNAALTLTGAGVGETMVTVTATDGTGGAASDDFMLVVTAPAIGASQVAGVHEALLPQLTLTIAGRTTQVLGDRIRSARAGAYSASANAPARGSSTDSRPAEPELLSIHAAFSSLPANVAPGRDPRTLTLPLIGLMPGPGQAGGEVLLSAAGVQLVQANAAPGRAPRTVMLPLLRVMQEPGQVGAKGLQPAPGRQLLVAAEQAGIGHGSLPVAGFEVFDAPRGWDAQQLLTLRQLLRRGLNDLSFALPLSSLAGSGGGSVGQTLTLWGEGGYTDLSARGDRAVDWDGEMASAHLGIDGWLREGLLLGAALSRTEGWFDYVDRSAGGRPLAGEYEISLTGVHPYADWAVADGLNAWGALSYGLGDVTLKVDEEEYREEKDVDLYGFSAGMVGSLYRGAAWSTAVKAEVTYAGLSVEEFSDAEVYRLRAILEGVHRVRGAAGEFEQFVELGARVDGGDVVSGAGLDVAGGLGWSNETGWRVQLRGSGLVANEDYREWQVGGMLEKTYRADGTGWMLKLSPNYRPARSFGGMEEGTRRLWEANVAGLARDANGDELGGYRLSAEAELGYGLIVGNQLWTLYTQGTGLGEGAGRFAVGAETTGRLGEETLLKVGFEGARESSRHLSAEHMLWMYLELGYWGYW